MQRRDFIKSSVQAIAGYSFLNVIPSGVWAQTTDRPTPSNRLTMGFIGIGNMSLGDMSSFLNDPRVQVLASCDINESNFNKGRLVAKKKIDDFNRNSDCKAYPDFRELMARPDIDAVYIGTPDHWHAPIIMEALRRGKDIYGQKPLTHTAEEGRRVVEGVQRYRRVFQTGSQQRSSQLFRRAVELVQNGRIGKLESIVIGLPTGKNPSALPPEKEVCPPGYDWDFYLGPAPYQPYSLDLASPNWRWNYDLGGGALMDWVGHHVDIAMWAMDIPDKEIIRFDEIIAEFGAQANFNTAEKYSFVCTFKSGVKMTVSSTAKQGIEFIGKEGSVFCCREKMETSRPEITGAIIGPEEIRLEPCNNHAKNFIDCCFSRKEPIAPARQAHRSALIGHVATIAMRLGRSTVQWNGETERFIDDPQADRLLTKEYRGEWFV